MFSEASGIFTLTDVSRQASICRKTSIQAQSKHDWFAPLLPIGQSSDIPRTGFRYPVMVLPIAAEIPPVKTLIDEIDATGVRAIIVTDNDGNVSVDALSRHHFPGFPVTLCGESQ